MIRIGLSGTNWTRKTTTIRKVVAELDPQSVDVISLGELVAKCPYPMGPQQTLDGSRWMTDQVFGIVDSPNSSANVQLFDRTPLDILAFTLYAAINTTAPAIDLPTLLNDIRRLGSRFECTFLCRPAHEWPKPVEPAQVQLTFARVIDSYLVQAVQDWTSMVIALPWQSEERVKSVKSHLIGKGNIRECANRP